MNKAITTLLTLAATGTLTHAAALYTAGHGDIGIAYEAGALEPHVHIHDGSIVNGIPVNNPPDGAEFAPDEVVIFVSNPSVARPSGASWDFLGTPSGNPVWFLPQTEDPAKPWLGIASEELNPLEWTGPLTITLTGFSGPGHFSLYNTDAFGTPTVRMASSDGLSGADALSHTAGSHFHSNYAFTAPGMYDVTFLISGTHAVDGAVSASATYTFGVTVPEPGSAVLGLLAGSMLLRRRRA